MLFLSINQVAYLIMHTIYTKLKYQLPWVY